MHKYLLGGLLLLASILPTSAQQLVKPCYFVSQFVCQEVSAGTPLPVVPGSGGTAFPITINPSGAAASGITPVVSGSAEACHVLSAVPASLYSVYAVNLTSTPGYLVVTNTTTAPTDGAITPLDFVPLPASGSASINYGIGPPSIYSTGITACITSAATVFTKTTGVITGAISGKVKAP